MPGGSFGCDDYPLIGKDPGKRGCDHAAGWKEYSNTCGAWQQCLACGFTKQKKEECHG